MPSAQQDLVAQPVAIEVRINGRPIQLDLPPVPWRRLLNEVALGAAPAIMEQALEVGGRQDAVIEVWDAAGCLLLALSVRVQADWQRRAVLQQQQQMGSDEPAAAEPDPEDAPPGDLAIGRVLAYLPGNGPGGNVVETRAGT